MQMRITDLQNRTREPLTSKTKKVRRPPRGNLQQGTDGNVSRSPSWRRDWPRSVPAPPADADARASSVRRIRPRRSAMSVKVDLTPIGLPSFIVALA